MSEQRIREIDQQIAKLEEERRLLKAQLDDQKSRAFIDAAGITPDQVESSNGHGWFGTAYEFGRWLKENSTKRYAEWNQGIYYRRDLIEGDLSNRLASMSTFERAKRD